MAVSQGGSLGPLAVWWSVCWWLELNHLCREVSTHVNSCGFAGHCHCGVTDALHWRSASFVVERTKKMVGVLE